MLYIAYHRMTVPSVLLLATVVALTACASSPHPYPERGIAYPTQGITVPRLSHEPFEIEDDLVSTPTVGINPGQPENNKLETIPTDLPE
jgi:hypothetical protein